MFMSKMDIPPDLGEDSSAPQFTADVAARVEALSERQRSYLRLVLRLKTSKEIAVATGSSSYRAVDKQLLKANAALGVATRFEAAQLVAAYDQGVEPLPPANALPFASFDPRLSPPWPTAGAAVNMLSWKRVASWVAIISIVTPVGLTAAGMAFLTILFLLRIRPF